MSRYLKFSEEEDFKNGALATLAVGGYTLKSEDYKQLEEKLQPHEKQSLVDRIIAYDWLSSHGGYMGIEINDFGVLRLYGHSLFIKIPWGEYHSNTFLYSLSYLKKLADNKSPCIVSIDALPFFKINAVDVDQNEMQITLDRKIELIKD